VLPLSHHKRQPPQRGQHHRELLRAVTDLVLAVIALMFQRVARCICEAPPRSRPLHEAVHGALVDAQVGDPTAMRDCALHRLPALEAVDAL
jgi:hypothetical protein